MKAKTTFNDLATKTIAELKTIVSDEKATALTRMMAKLYIEAFKDLDFKQVKFIIEQINGKAIAQVKVEGSTTEFEIIKPTPPDMNRLDVSRFDLSDHQIKFLSNEQLDAFMAFKISLKKPLRDPNINECK